MYFWLRIRKQTYLFPLCHGFKSSCLWSNRHSYIPNSLSLELQRQERWWISTGNCIAFIRTFGISFAFLTTASQSMVFRISCIHTSIVFRVEFQLCKGDVTGGDVSGQCDIFPHRHVEVGHLRIHRRVVIPLNDNVRTSLGRTPSDRDYICGREHIRMNRGKKVRMEGKKNRMEEKTKGRKYWWMRGHS